MLIAPKCILVVDDDPGIRQIITRHLSNVGWDVVSAGTAQEALSAFTAGRFCAILTDVDLGDKPDGVEVAKRLLNQDPDLKVVIMSGQPQHAKRVREANLGTFMAKPFELPELDTLLSLK